MNRNLHERMADRLEEYALGQLTPAEQRDFESHLRECATCADELREIGEALALVAESVPAKQPPATLKRRVLTAIAVQPQDPDFHVPAVAARTATPRLRWMALAAAVIIVALAGSLFVIESSRRVLSRDLQRATADAADVRERLREYSGQTDLALSILTANDMRELPLAGRENAVAAAARAYWSPTRGLLVVADRLPVPPPGRIYQVWVISGGRPASAGLLDEPASGRGMLIVPPPQIQPGAGVTIAVTDEPPGGLPAPSGVIRLAGSI